MSGAKWETKSDANQHDVFLNGRSSGREEELRRTVQYEEPGRRKYDGGNAALEEWDTATDVTSTCNNVRTRAW
jgi:hypothetical protein